MHQKLLLKILEKYQVKADKIFPPEKGYRNRSYKILDSSGNHHNLIVYKNEKQILERINRAHAVAKFLEKSGLPVRIPKGQIVKISSGDIDRFVCLYNYLPGKTIPWEGYTKKHVKLLGKTMSDMHASLDKFPNPEKLSQASKELLELNLQMKNYFQKPNVQKAMADNLKVEINPKTFETNEKLLSFSSKSKRQIPLHLDFVRSNVLFGKTSEGELAISGIIDFEKVGAGSEIIDIARTLAFLIVDCKYKSEKKVRKYFLQSGYQKRGQNALPDLKLLPSLLNFFWMYDYYKFLLHNPYESLEQNEHYQRTKTKLLSMGVLILLL